MKIDIAIIDDCVNDIEKVQYALLLTSVLPELIDVKLVSNIYTDPIEFVKTEKEYHIALIDVEMPGMSGFEVAEQLNEKYPNCLVIFLTSHVDRAKEGYKVRTHRFATKPIDQEEINEAIISGINQFRSFGNVEVTKEGVYKVLELEEIVYFESLGNTSIVYTASENFDCKDSLKKLEKKLPNGMFFRVHKQYIVNMAYYSGMFDKKRGVFTCHVKAMRRRYLLQ